MSELDIQTEMNVYTFLIVWDEVLEKP